MSDSPHNLGIGVFGLSTGLMSLLDSLGVNYEECYTQKVDEPSYSVYIVHRALTSKEQKWLQNQHEKAKSLAVLFTLESGIQPKSTSVQKTYCASVHSPHLMAGPLAHLSVIDCFSKVSFYGGKQDLDGICYVERQKSEHIEQSIYLGIPLEASVSKFSYTRKFFPSPTGHKPNEIVSRTHKGHLQHLLRYALERLFYSIDLPYLSKWNFPTSQAIITLRIDSDFGTEKSLQAIYELANTYSAVLTTFLHVKAHEDWLEWFTQWPNHEHSLHGYEHAHIRSSYPLYQDIENGYQAMVDAGMTPKGYAAPYGIWTEQLSKALDAYPFSYSSEFTHGYDALPYCLPDALATKPALYSKRLQIPVHPICTGSLHRYRAVEKDFNAYFKHYMDIQYGMQQPIMLYHHPLQPGLSSIQFIMEYAQELDLQWLSYHEWATFWMQRASERIDIYYDKQKKLLISKDKPTLLYELKQDSPDFAIIHPNDWDVQNMVPIHTLSLQTKKSGTMADNEFLQNRFSNKWQLWKESFIQNRNRIRL